MAAVPDPRTLLLPDPDEVPSVLKDTFIPSVAAGIATVAVYAANAGTRRPRYSGRYTVLNIFLCRILNYPF